jgi:uncharacterized repeat protein (TIGR01451 family)
MGQDTRKWVTPSATALVLGAGLLAALPAHAATIRFGTQVYGSLDAICGNADDSRTLVVTAGTPVYICYAEFNPANFQETISNVKVVDSYPVAGTQVPGSLTLIPGATGYLKMGPYTATTTQTHSATATGTGSKGNTWISGPDVDVITVVHPSLTVQKTASTSGSCPGVELVTVAPGTPVTYCYAVTNGGDTAISNVTVNDNGTIVSIGNLAAGATGNGSTGIVATVDVSTTAVASGTTTATNTPVSSPPDGAAVKVVAPALTIATTVSLNGACPGQEIVNVLTGTPVTWCYVVTNSGAIAVNGVTVTDDVYGALGAPPVNLAAGQSVTLSRPSPAAPVGIAADTTLTASAAGVAPVTNAAVHSNLDPAAVNVVGPHIDIDVTVSTTGTCPGVDVATVAGGSSVVYCYDVSNIGDDDLLTVDVTDAGSSLVGTLPILSPGQSHLFVGAPTVITADATELATATGTDPYGFGVTSSDLAKVHPLFPSVTIAKTVSVGGSCPGVELATVLTGSSVTYCYQVTNNGGTALGAITVVDDNGAVVNVPDLAPGAAATVSAPYVATVDVDTQATAHATNALNNQPVASAPDDAAVKVVAPALWVSKTVSTDGTCPGVELVTVLPGAAVTYCYTVTNAGNTPVAGVVINDDGVVIDVGVLQPGQSGGGSSTAPATADSSTSAVASGTETTLGTPVVSPPDGAAVDVVHPALVIAKTVSLDGTCPGSELVTVLSGTAVTYCYTVTNPGDTTVNDVFVTDAGVTISVGSIVAGGSATGTGGIVAFADTSTAATAAGTDASTGTPVTSGPDGAAVDVVSPSLAIAKTVSVGGSCPGVELATVLPGTAVAWCYAVTNTGDTALSGVVVNDDDGSVIAIGDLAPGATGNGAAPFVASTDVSTPASASGAVTATGTTVTSPLDGAAVDVVHPALVIQKTVSAAGTCPGVELVTVLANTAVTYCYTVTNAGDTAISGVSVDDAGNLVAIGDLAPGQSGSGARTFPALADESTLATAGGTTTATGTPITSAPDGASVDVVAPALAISTTVSTTGACPGQEVVNVLAGAAVTWCYAVTNTGDTAVAGITVTDNQYGQVPGAAFALAPGQTHTLSLPVSANVDVTVTASAAGTAPATGSPVVSPQDPAVVNVVSPNIDLDVTVSTDGACPGVDSVTVPAGTSVVYCYKVTNNGDDVLSDVVVTDGANAVIATLSDLAPGQSTTVASAAQPVNGDQTVPATATGTDLYGNPVSDSDTALVHALFAKLAIQKTVSLSGACPGVELITVLPGTAATYCYLVTNSGDTAVTAVQVDDNGAVVPGGNLAAGQSVIVSRAVTVSGHEDTFAVAAGTNPYTGQPVVSAEDDAVIEVVHPTLSIAKTVSLDGTCPGVELVTVLPGTAATYCYVVTNTGDTTIGDVHVGDAGALLAGGTLVAGQSTTLSAPVTAGQTDLDTFAVATGTDTATWTKITSPDDDAAIHVIHPALGISTTVSTTGACPGLEVVNVLAGTSVTWCYVVTNTGDVSVTGIHTSDDQYGALAGTTTLAPGQSATLSRAVVESADVTATAVAVGSDGVLGTPVVSNHDPAVVNVVSPSVDLDVTVSTNGACPGVDAVTVPAGTSVTYCYKVINNGDDTLTNVVVKDPNGNVITVIASLGAGASSTFTGATVTLLSNVTVTGTATATDQYGYPVSDTDSALVQVLHANLHVVKTAPAQITASGAGVPVAYTLAVSNLGQTAAVNAVVTDALPAGETFVSATVTGGSCSYAAGTVTCALGNLAPAAQVTITVNVSVTAMTGSITNTAVVSSSSPDSDPSDNTSSATTQIVGGGGATRTLGFYANHPTFTQACLTSLGGSMNLGWFTIRDEAFDNEIDSTAVGNGGDKDTRKETGISMLMGLLNANVAHYTNKAARSALEQSKMQAAHQLATAICNWKYLGTAPSFDINGMLLAMKGTNSALILGYSDQADAFNNSGDAQSIPMNPGAANAKYPGDDPTDPND